MFPILRSTNVFGTQQHWYSAGMKLMLDALSCTIMFCILVVPARAQETDASNDWQAPSMEERRVRSEGFREAVLATKQGMLLLQDMEQTSRAALERNREECSAALRKANRDSKLPTMLQCYWHELVTQRDRITRMQQFFENAPGISPEVRAEALEKAGQLLDAIETIAIGIDARVYRSVEELPEAKIQLRERYWKPYWEMSLRVRADRLKTWIAHLLIRAEETRALAEFSPEERATLRRGMLCLEQGEFFMDQIVKSEEYKETKFLFSQSLIHLRICAKLLRDVQGEATDDQGNPS